MSAQETTGYPPRLRALIAGALALATPVVVGAAVSLGLDPPSSAEGLAVLLFLALALLAELKPVPLEEDDLSTVSLAFVFILASVILFGWQEAVLVATVSACIAQVVERKPLERTAFNTAVYALSAFAAALPVFFLGSPTEDPVAITVDALLGGAAFVAVNFAFITLAISFHQRIPVLPLLKEEVRLVGPAFTIQAFLAALAAALWATDPRLLVLMAGPLFTVTLYQRSSLASRRATRDAHTDSLTLIGNNRAYELGLSTALDSAAESGEFVSLCLVDVDDFKQINDTYGHPLGDQVLVEVAGLLRTERDCLGTFRFGGDEFAIVLGCGERQARAHVESLYRRLSIAEFSHGASATVSVGLATFPDQAADIAGLERAADIALYWAKQNGKNRFCAYSPSVAEAQAPEELERRIERHARLRAAENLIRVVDAKDEYTGAHSERVALLVEAIARQLELDDAAGRAAEARGPPPRPRQDRHPGPRAPEARRAHSARGAAAGASPRARCVAPRRHGHPSGGRLDQAPPRALGRLRLPARSRRGGDPVRLEAHSRRRRLRRDHDGSQLPRRGHARGGAGRAEQSRGQTVRPGGRRRVARPPGERRSRRIAATRPPRRAARRLVVVLAFPVLLALGLGLVLGGSVGRLAEIRLRAPWLFLAAIGLQIVAFPVAGLPWQTHETAASVLWVASYALLVVAAALNRRIAGVPVVAAGMLLNLVAILANRGTMPVSYEAMHGAGRSAVTQANSTAMSDPSVPWLVDRWAAPDWLPLANVYSVGDVVIAVGAFVIVLAAMGAQRPTLTRLTRRPSL